VPEVAFGKWCSAVPKTDAANLAYRKDVLRRCARSPIDRIAFRQACSEDMLFWLNVFVWTFDPRSKHTTRPFITWDYQDETLTKLEEVCQLSEESEDPQSVHIEKSRDMGASWMCVAWMLWRWQFHGGQSFLMVSRKEDLVDGQDDSLFGFMDKMLRHQPRWLVPRSIKRTHLKLRNNENGSVIEGESTNENIGRGGRRKTILIDEAAAFADGGWDMMSSTASATRMRIFNSTPKGNKNAFADARKRARHPLRLHWSRHPVYGRGLYRVHHNGDVDVLDPKNLPKDYAFQRKRPSSEEGTRSPWYDNQVADRGSSHEIAQELDIDYLGSDFPFFSTEIIHNLIREYAKDESLRGELVRRGDFWEFQPSDRGRLRIWQRLIRNEPIPDRDYVLGVDVSSGTGASNSVCCVWDRVDGSRVAEWVSNTTAINHFASAVYDIGHFFHGQSKMAFVIFEGTGPGQTLMKILVDQLKYSHVYMSRDDTKLGAKQTDRPGWYSSKEGRKDLLEQYKQALQDKSFINPCKEALDECLDYIWHEGYPEHTSNTGRNDKSDPSNKGLAHGDRVIADALAVKVLGARGGPQREKGREIPQRKPGLDTLAGRRLQSQRESQGY